MYLPEQNLDKLAARFAAQARGRKVKWANKPGTITLLGSKKDRHELRELIAYAEQHSPTARQALQWARSHGLTIRAEQKNKGYLGCYRKGLIALRMCPSFDQRGIMMDARSVNTLVHEIRHAWQDYYNLIDMSIVGDLTTRTSDSLILTALYEADATALGGLAGEECAAKGATNPTAVLAEGFMAWFPNKGGIYVVDKACHLFSIKNPITRSFLTCFNFTATRKNLKQYDWERYLVKLGRTFDGFNYIAAFTPEQRDKVLRFILAPSNVMRCYQQSDPVCKVTESLDVQDRKKQVIHSSKQYSARPLARIESVVRACNG